MERQVIEVSRSKVDEAFNEKRYQDAQEISTLADAAKAVLDEKDAVFENDPKRAHNYIYQPVRRSGLVP